MDAYDTNLALFQPPPVESAVSDIAVQNRLHAFTCAFQLEQIDLVVLADGAVDLARDPELHVAAVEPGEEGKKRTALVLFFGRFLEDIPERHVEEVDSIFVHEALSHLEKVEAMMNNQLSIA